MKILEVQNLRVGFPVVGGVFALARDRRLPKMAATVSRFGTPVGAIVLLMMIQALWILLAEAASDTLLVCCPGTPHYFSIFVWGATFGGFALIVVYLVMSVSGLFGLSKDEGYAGVVVSSLVGIVVTAGAIFGSFYKVPSPTVLASWYALIWGVLGLLYMFAVRGREPASEALPDLHA